jgi:ABC transporter substrate binding protein
MAVLITVAAATVIAIRSSRCPAQTARGLLATLLRRRRRPHLPCARSNRPISAGRRLRRSHPQGSPACAPFAHPRAYRALWPRPLAHYEPGPWRETCDWDATASIPIVFNIATDPQVAGFVASLARPGGNLTGVSQLRSAVVAKRLQMLHEIAPAATLIGVLVNPGIRIYTQDMNELEAASRTLGVHLATVNSSKDDGIEPAIEALVAQGVGALLVTASGLFTLNNARIIALAARHRLPAIYQNSVFTKNGGLLSYGSDLIDTYHLAGVFAGRILNGERPAEMPVQQAVKIDMILNLKTAKALALTVPESILLRADEVIE